MSIILTKFLWVTKNRKDKRSDKIWRIFEALLKAFVLNRTKMAIESGKLTLKKKKLQKLGEGERQARI